MVLNDSLTLKTFNTHLDFFLGTASLLLLLVLVFLECCETGVASCISSTRPGMLPFFLCLSFFFSFFSFSFLFGLLACGWDKAASCSWTAFNCIKRRSKFSTNANKGWTTNLLPLKSQVWSLTCSWSSANLWALSSSESSVEDSDSEDESLELSEDEAMWAKGGCGLTGAGW